MKRIVASVGLVALGASSLSTASAQVLSGPDGSKPWSVSGTLRGFYDDNINTVSKDVDLGEYHRASSGFEVKPGAKYSLDMEQTKLDLGYSYSYKYFDNKHIGQDGRDSQSHSFDGSLLHSFNEQWKVTAEDSFVVGQEPDTLAIGSSPTTTYYVRGDNYRNYGAAALSGQLTPTFGTELGYDNTYYHYEDTSANGVGIRLNRMEHQIHLDGRVALQPETTGVLGFSFRQIGYDSDKEIFTGVMADARDSRIYRPYAGLEHTFTPQLTGSVRVGGEYSDYYNDAGSGAKNDWSPYAAINGRYNFAPQSYFELGFTHTRGATDQLGLTATSYTVDQQYSTLYGKLSYGFTPKLVGNVTASYQDSSFKGGSVNGRGEQLFSLGLDLQYRFNQYLSAEVGYNYDNLSSDLSRAYDRNRVYIGLTASY
jgi:hypothetical protein